MLKAFRYIERVKSKYFFRKRPILQSPYITYKMVTMVAQNTVRTYRINQVFRFVEGTWLPRRGQNQFFFSEKTYFISNVRNMLLSTILYKYHAKHILNKFMCTFQISLQGVFVNVLT